MDTLYIVGKDADISNVRVKFEDEAWQVYYAGKRIAGFENRKASKDALTIGTAKSVELRNWMGTDKCRLEGLSSISIKLPKYAIEAYCPIDMLVYNAEGAVVQYLRDGEEYSDFTEYGMFLVSYNAKRNAYEKQVYLFEEGYSVKIKGNDDGVMEYRVTKAEDDGTIVTYANEAVEVIKDVTWAVDTDNLAKLTDSCGNVTEVALIKTVSCVYGELEDTTEQQEPDGTVEPDSDADATADENTGGMLLIFAGGALIVVALAAGLVVLKKKRSNG